MRVALLTYSTKPRGGVVHTLALAEALAEAGEDVTVWSLGRDGDATFFRPVAPDVRIELVPFANREGEDVGERIVRSIAVLRAAFRPADYDIVHAQDCISANAVERCVRTIHHLDQFHTPELVACHERAIRRPYAHICVSDSVAEEVRVGWGITPAVIPNGVDAARFATADPAPWRARFGRYVLSVGGIEPRKGSIDLLAAYARVLATDPDVRLVIAGGETLFDYRDYRARWEDIARQLDVQPIVLGTVANQDLPGLVAGATVFAFPSTKEGFGLAAMEALAAGVPLVTRDLPVLRQIFAGAAHFATDPAGLAEGLRAALAGPNPHREAGVTLAAGYTWAAAAQAHQRFYRALCAPR